MKKNYENYKPCFKGIPDEPEELIIDKINTHEAVLEWKSPKIINGVIKEYLIEATKLCSDSSGVCDDIPCEVETFTHVTSKTNSILDKLIPWTIYSIRVAGKTEHKEIGHFSQPIRFKTLAGTTHEPEILKTSQTKRGGLVIDFNYPCPLTGNTTFHAKYQASVASNLTLKVTSLTHRKH